MAKEVRVQNKTLKQKMLDLFRETHNELDRLAANLTDEEKERRGKLDQWSASDLFSHLAFWGNHFNSQMEAAKKGEYVPSAGDYYLLLNDGVFIRNVDKSFEETRRMEGDAFRKTMEILDAIDADDLNDPEKYEFLNKRPIIDRALGTEGWHIAQHLSEFYMSRGEKEKAVSLQETFTNKLLEFPGWKANAVYNLACFYSQQNMLEEAISNLKTAFAERPELIDWSRKDTDLDPIRDSREYKNLIEDKEI